MSAYERRGCTNGSERSRIVCTGRLSSAYDASPDWNRTDEVGVIRRRVPSVRRVESLSLWHGQTFVKTDHRLMILVRFATGHEDEG